MAGAAQAGIRPACFVIMPFDPKLNRVYELILAPACRKAGFEPERADTARASERITNHLLTRLIESELVLVDLTSRNPNVLYELGVRHACGGGSVLVQCRGTERIFDIQDIRTTEYDGQLTEESVQRDIEAIAAQIGSTYQRGRAENLVYRAAGSLGFAGKHDQGYRSFLRRLREVPGRVRILVTFAYFLNDAALLRNAFARMEPAGRDAKLLLLDPGSPAAVQRGHDRPDKDVPAEIRNNVLNISQCLGIRGEGLHEEGLECKLYSSIPPFALFQCGGEATLIFYEYRKDLKDTQSFTFSMGTPLGQYVTNVFEELWKSADMCLPITDYLALRAWFGTYLDGVRYLRGRECHGKSASHPDLWLLLTREQYLQASDHIESAEPVEIDDVLPGKYLVEKHPIEGVRRVAVQKYGEAAASHLTVALAASRRKAAFTSGRR